jgi:hypothetical protein
MKIQKFAVIGLVLAALLAACSSNSATPTAAPMATATPAPSGIDWTMHGFPNVLITQHITPGNAATIEVGPYIINVPADAFTTPVTLEVLSGDPSSFASNAPSGEVPVLAFAFDVRDANGNLIVKFNNPVTLTANDTKIFADSKYYNVAADGAFTENSSGLQVAAGELSHPIAGTPVGWVITTPTAEAGTASGG